MTPGPVSFLDALQASAESAASEEERFRRDYARSVALLERERAHAFRRFNFMRSLAEAAAGESGTAVARVVAIFRDKLGWSGDTEARTATVEHFRPVIEAMVGALGAKNGETPPDVRAKLAEFEAWYDAAHGSAFWVLFDHYMPETPRVDF